MFFDAVILCGGRASRLGGIAKAELLADGSSLLQIAVMAASGAERVVVVGDAVPGLPVSTVFVREMPPHGGPAAALGAGMQQLAAGAPSNWVLVLACDMPDVRGAVAALLTAAHTAPASVDGLIAIDGERRRQYLAALYRAGALLASLDAIEVLEGVSLRAVVEPLRLREVEVPDDSTADIDNWADAARRRVTAPDDHVR